MTVYLIIDESGEKGYSKNISTDGDKFGTMSGYILFDFQIEIARKILKEIFSSFSSNGKIHMSALPKEEQKRLRETALGFLRDCDIKWVHMSIYNKGFKNYSDDEKLLLHSELFNGVFIKAISYIYDITRSEIINLKVISDTLDKRTIKQFEKYVLSLKNLMSGQRENIIHKKDYTMKTTVDFGDNFFSLDELTMDITCEDTELTLIADVLSHTTHDCLKQELELNPDTNLDAYQSLGNHPIQGLVYGCYDHTKENSINFLGTLYGK